MILWLALFGDINVPSATKFLVTLGFSIFKLIY
ncbi:Uncharacterised protein [Photobacterium damselae]|uniref:Uncharacterized protein n=1 Tax=Photobacterium damselae TaxID=38293 RepID=A0A2X1WDV4_PHODM|nr:Uncharacterised protein [Photobacterium damselae]